MLLPDNVIKRMRTQAFGKRRIRLAGEEVGHGGFRVRGISDDVDYSRSSENRRMAKGAIKTGYITTVIPAQAGMTVVNFSGLIFMALPILKDGFPPARE